MYKLHRHETNMLLSLSCKKTAKKDTMKTIFEVETSWHVSSIKNAQKFNKLTPLFTSEKTVNHTFNL